VTGLAALVAVVSGFILAAGIVGFTLAAGIFGAEDATGAPRALAIAASTLLIAAPVIMRPSSTDSHRPRTASQTPIRDQVCGSCGHCFSSLDDLIDHQTASHARGRD
jgi:hypothetical protein